MTARELLEEMCEKIIEQKSMMRAGLRIDKYILSELSPRDLNDVESFIRSYLTKADQYAR